MKIKKILFPFNKNHSFLSEKWWHRFFVVLFAVLVAFFFIGAVITAYQFIPEKKFNISIQYNLKDFTKTSARDVADTIPAFNLLNYEIGCLNGNDINYVSTYGLDKSVCSSDLKGNIDKVADLLMQKNYSYKGTKDQAIASLKIMLDKDLEQRYCFVSKDLNCTSDKIITYKKGYIFYAEVFLISVLLSYLCSLILQLMYFKGLIYIIYGKKK